MREMSDRPHTRLTLEVEQVEPISGRLLDERGHGRSFTGWLGLASALGSELPADGAPVPAPGAGGRGAAVASLALLAVEAVGTVLMWAPIPLAWLWIGGRVYSLTGSLGLDLAVAFFGSVATILLTMMALNRVDRAWVALRRRAGHDQKHGALAQVAIVSGTFGLVAFLLWYYLFTRAFVMPFMPSSG
jgi:hypothetical protein